MTAEELATWGGILLTALGGAFGLGQNKKAIEQHGQDIEKLKISAEAVPERLARLETHIENIRETNQAILEELRK